MVVRNNYYWLDDSSNAGFIANGDIVDVVKIKEIIERYGFRFAKATIKMTDYRDEKELDVILLLDTLISENPAITEVTPAVTPERFSPEGEIRPILHIIAPNERRYTIGDRI